ncbi:MAG: hypothetical protein RIR55_275, partial [Bacteroidota bacterium]
MRKNQLMGLTALAGLLFSVACSEKPKGPDKFNPNAPVSVDITVAENQQVEKGVEVNGSILA